MCALKSVQFLCGLFFLAPTRGIIVGPLKDRVEGHHECLSNRLWFGFRGGNMKEGADEDSPTCNSGGIYCEGVDNMNVSYFLIFYGKIYI